MIFTFLGSGTSYGIPMVGCHCAVCSSTDPRDKRLRSAGWLHDETHSILFDAGTDLRAQALRAGIDKVDAVFLSHTHADHLYGIDDLRAFSRHQPKPLPLYAKAVDLKFINEHFHYVFDYSCACPRCEIPHLEAREIGMEPVDVDGVKIRPIPLMHGRMQSLGFRYGDFSYLTDCNFIPESSKPLIAGSRIIVIDGLRWNEHTTHFNIPQAIEAACQFSPEKIYLTHIDHQVSYGVDSARLPQNVFLAYDMLSLDLDK